MRSPLIAGKLCEICDVFLVLIFAQHVVLAFGKYTEVKVTK